MYDIVALGEFLIDFTPLPDRAYRANPGGAPVNLLAAASRLGQKVGFIGKVGQDPFGDFLKASLVKYNIDEQGLLQSCTAPTTLAFVQLNEAGERAFQFYRNPGADTQLMPEELPYTMLSSCRLFHFGSLSLTHSPAKEATEVALQRVKSLGIPVSYDPNYRALLWQHLPEAEVKQRLLWGVTQANIVKLSFEELQWLFPAFSIAKGIHNLHQLGPDYVFITFGSEGSMVSTTDEVLYRPAFVTSVLDTTGAGDAFFGCALSCLLQDVSHWSKPTSEFLMDLLDSANAAGALCCSQYGAMPAMPTAEEIRDYKKSTPQRSPLSQPILQEVLDMRFRKDS